MKKLIRHLVLLMAFVISAQFAQAQTGLAYNQDACAVTFSVDWECSAACIGSITTTTHTQ